MSDLISKYFNWGEAVKTETGFNNLPDKLTCRNILLAAVELDKIREVVGPLKVNSWFRSVEVNRVVGGSLNSAHLFGWAIDIVSPNMSAYDLAKAVLNIQNIEFDQVIYEYGKWVHISFDPQNRKQVLTKFSGPYKKGILTKLEYFA